MGHWDTGCKYCMGHLFFGTVFCLLLSLLTYQTHRCLPWQRSKSGDRFPVHQDAQKIWSSGYELHILGSSEKDQWLRQAAGFHVLKCWFRET